MPPFPRGRYLKKPGHGDGLRPGAIRAAHGRGWDETTRLCQGGIHHLVHATPGPPAVTPLPVSISPVPRAEYHLHDGAAGRDLDRRKRLPARQCAIHIEQQPDHLAARFFLNENNGVIEVVNAEGKVAARVGEFVSLGGGGVQGGAAWSATCASAAIPVPRAHFLMGSVEREPVKTVTPAPLAL